MEKIRLAEAILMSTHNIYFYGKNKQNYCLTITKYPPYLFHWLGSYAMLSSLLLYDLVTFSLWKVLVTIPTYWLQYQLYWCSYAVEIQ